MRGTRGHFGILAETAAFIVQFAFLRPFYTHPRVRPDGPGKKEEKERARPFFELLLASFTFFIRFYLADLRAFSSSWKVEKTVKKNPPQILGSSQRSGAAARSRLF